jgi:hypothetical protein
MRRIALVDSFAKIKIKAQRKQPEKTTLYLGDILLGDVRPMIGVTATLMWSLRSSLSTRQAKVVSFWLRAGFDDDTVDLQQYLVCE